MNNCGRLNKKITFYRQDDELYDDFSKIGKKLVPVRTVWASMKPTTAQESFEQQRLYNTVTYDVRTRYIQELENPDLIIMFKGERYEIRSVVNLKGESQELGFTCLKVEKGAE